jgi:hypothetical protein
MMGGGGFGGAEPDYDGDGRPDWAVGGFRGGTRVTPCCDTGADGRGGEGSGMRL